MKIAYLSPVGVIGGAEQCLLNCIFAMRQTLPKAELHLIAAGDGPLLERARAAGAQVHLLQMPADMARLGDSILRRGHTLPAMARLAERMARAVPATRTYVAQLRTLLRRLHPDLLHSNGLKSHLLAHLAGGEKRKIVWHLHDFLAERPAMGRALRWASQSAAGVIAISQAIAKDARLVLPGRPVEVVYNAIDVERFSPRETDGATLDALAGLRPPVGKTLRVGLVATYARWKGHEVLMRAAARLTQLDATMPVRFYIIGGPIYATQGSQYSEFELRRLAASLGVSDRFGFIGFQSHTEDVYRALDIVLHTSTSPEPFGLTIIEAMACGRPVIVSQAGGAAELFAHEADAVGVKPNDPDDLALATLELLRTPDRRKKLGQNARVSAVARFSRDRLGSQMLSAYHRLLPAHVKISKNAALEDSISAHGLADGQPVA